MTDQKIRKEEATRYDYVIKSALDEEVEALSYPYLYREFDENGNLVQEMSYDTNGDIQEYYTYKYDERHRRVEVINYYDEEEISETIIYNYGDGDHPLEAKRVFADGSEDTIFYTYDDAGNLVEKRIVNDEDEEEEGEIWRFENNLEVFYEKREYEEPVFREAKEYDSSGRPILITVWEALDNRTIRQKIHYDSSGRQNRIERYNAEGKLATLIEVTEFLNDEPSVMKETGTGGVKTTKFTYDDKGNILLQQEFNQHNQLTNEVKRTYTEEGNLLTTDVTNDRQGEGMNMHYRIEYSYEFF